MEANPRTKAGRRIPQLVRLDPEQRADLVTEARRRILSGEAETFDVSVLVREALAVAPWRRAGA